MTTLKKSIQFETAFETYVATELIGQGGAGRVYGAQSTDAKRVAIKLLAEDRASSDKRRRFKNETAFLARVRHGNLVGVLDHGVLAAPSLKGPFYVMERYDSSLRSLIGKLEAPEAFALFSQLLDGVEAAHLHGVVHRDLKPENILFDKSGGRVAVADFGVARFTEDLLVTHVETATTQRLANFQYAAPEQRAHGRPVDKRADLYALGLILNELFTGEVPHGTEYKQITSVAPAFAFLDPIVAQLLRQSASDRPGSIEDIKSAIQRYQAEAVSLQRLDTINQTVVPAASVVDPLQGADLKLVSIDWQDGQGGSGNLVLIFDRNIPEGWPDDLRNMGSYESVRHRGPEQFQFHGNKAFIHCNHGEAKDIVKHFKGWIPRASEVYRRRLVTAARRKEYERTTELQRQREAEERRLELLRSIKLT